MHIQAAVFLLRPKECMYGIIGMTIRVSREVARFPNIVVSIEKLNMSTGLNKVVSIGIRSRTG